MEVDDSNNKAELRKIRKKLREIERLTTEVAKNRALSVEEEEKVAKKAEYEERLRQLEGQVSAGSQAEINHALRQSKFVKLPQWAGLKFDASRFTGHEEPVSSLTSFGTLADSTLNLARFVSTSSDTTARLWNIVPKTVEEIDAEQAQWAVFSGHTLTVTCALMVADARRWFSADFVTSITQPNGVPNRADEALSLLVTSSLDCNISVWCLESGKLLYSLYTYQPVTQMALVDVDLVFTGTENGKLELWNLREKNSLYSAVFDKNAAPIGWIVRANDTGHVIACSQGDLLGVFELTSDPLVGAMINQCFTSDELKTSRGEAYSLRKVTGLVAYDSRIYVTTRHRPTIKAIGWDQGTGLKVNRFAGRHYDNGSFVALHIWSPSSGDEESSFLFACESNNASPSNLAIHVHSLPHKSYALSNFYVGSLVIPFDDYAMGGSFSLKFTVGSMSLKKNGEENEEEKREISPCILCSINDSFLVLSPSIYPATVNPAEGSTADNKVAFSQLELYPKPSVVNFSVNLHSDQFGDDTISSEEKSERLTTEDETGAVVVASARSIPGIKKARLEPPNEEDDNPPTDVEDEDDDYATHVDNVQGGRGRAWTFRKMCLIL